MANYKKDPSIGPGGTKCQCCVPFARHKKNKRIWSRRYRQNNKIDVDAELDDVLCWGSHLGEDNVDWESIWAEQENVEYYNSYLEEREAMEASPGSCGEVCGERRG